MVDENPSAPGVIADAKTGKPCAKTKAEVLTYMASSPWINRLGGISRPLEAKVICADGAFAWIPAEVADEAFR